MVRDDDDVKEIHRHAIDQIAAARLETEPFPHIIVDRFLPEPFYRELLKNFPDRSEFDQVTYPGTGHGKKTSRFHEHGLAYRKMGTHPYFRVVDGLFASEEFSRALLDRFGRPLPDGKTLPDIGTTPIPADKHAHFAGDAHDFSPVYDFQIDLPGYEIPPHPDIPEKIVTFQFFLTEDAALKDFGTIFLKARNANGTGVANRSATARKVGRFLEKSMRRLGLKEKRVYQRLEQSGFGLWAGIGITKNWLPWDLFEVRKIAQALPNHFMAFAPNAVSYHAVRMNIPPESPRQERPVVRGFIRTGRNTANWIEPVKM